MFGHDGGVQYGGTFEPSPESPDRLDVRLKLVVPPCVPLVQGVPPQPGEHDFIINVQVPARGTARLRTETPCGPIAFQIRFLRPLPERLAA